MVLRLLVASFLIAGASGAAPAPPVPPEPAPPAAAGQIARIDVTDFDGRPLPEEAAARIREALAAAGLRPGFRFDLRSQADAVATLESRFDVRVSWNAAAGVLTVLVRERPVLEEVVIRGNRYFTEQDVRNFLGGVTEGVRIRENEIVERLANLAKEYRDKNFYFVRVVYDQAALARQRRLIIDVSEGPRVRVRRIAFEGLAEVDPDDLLKQIQTRVRLWPIERGVLDDDRVAADVTALEDWLQGQGYLNARVGRRIEFLDPARTDAVVVFTVYEGVRFRVNDIRFVRRRPAPDRPEGADGFVYTDQELEDRLASARGRFFTRARYEKDLAALRDAYGELGRFQTRIAAPARPPIARDVAEEGFVDLVFDIEEARQVRVGRIDVFNNRDLKDRVLLRVLRRHGIAPGEVFNTVALRRAREELEETGLFAPTRERPFQLDFQDVDPRGNEPDIRDLRADVNVRDDTRKYLFEIGFDTNLGVAGRFSYVDENFDITDWPDDVRELLSNIIPGRGDAVGRPFSGAGERFRFRGRLGDRRNSVILDWFTPYLLDTSFQGGADIYLQQTVYREQFDEARFGFTLSVGRRQLDGPWSWELALRPEIIDISNLDEPTSPELADAKGTFGEVHVIASVTLDRRERDSTDRTAFTTGGDRLILEAIPSFGSFQYLETNLRYQRYFTVRTDVEGGRDVVQIGGRVGYIFNNPPVFDSFYAGGVGTVRGFEFRGISPRGTGTDNRIGGDFIAVVSAEYSFPIFRTTPFALRGLAFIDAGTVAREFDDVSIRVSAGPGLRVNLGGSPLEIGLGFPIARERQDDRQVFYITGGFGF
jgi:outer membrane protein assembly factor BamA